MKVCPSCSASVPDSARLCPSCDHEFPEADDDTSQTMMGMSLDGRPTDQEGVEEAEEAGVDPSDTAFGLPSVGSDRDGSGQQDEAAGEPSDQGEEEPVESQPEAQASSDDLLDIGDERTVPAKSEDLLGDLGFGAGDASDTEESDESDETNASEGPSSTQFGMPAVDPSEEAERQQQGVLEGQETSPAGEAADGSMHEESGADWFGSEDDSNDDLFAAWGVDEDDDPKSTMHGVGPGVGDERDSGSSREAGDEDTSEADARYETRMGMGPPDVGEALFSDYEEEGQFNSVVFAEQDTPTHHLDESKVEEIDRQVKKWEDSKVQRFPEDPDKPDEDRNKQREQGDEETAEARDETEERARKTEQESLQVDDDARWLTGTVEKAIEEGKEKKKKDDRGGGGRDDRRAAQQTDQQTDQQNDNGPTFPDPDESPEASPEAREERGRPGKAAQSGIIRLPGQSNKGNKPDESAEERNLGASGVLNLPGRGREEEPEDVGAETTSREQSKAGRQGAAGSESEGSATRQRKDSGLFGNSTYIKGNKEEGEGTGESQKGREGRPERSLNEKSGVFGDDSQGPTGFRVEESEAIELEEKLDSKPFPGVDEARAGAEKKKQEAQKGEGSFAAVEHSEMTDEGLGEDSLEEVDFSHMDDEDSSFEFMDENEQSGAWLGSVADDEEGAEGTGTARFGGGPSSRSGAEEGTEDDGTDGTDGTQEEDGAGAFPELDPDERGTGQGTSAEKLLEPSEPAAESSEVAVAEESEPEEMEEEQREEARDGEREEDGQATEGADSPEETPALDGGAVVGLLGGVLLAGYAAYGPLTGGLPAAGVGIAALIVSALGAVWAFIGSTIFPARLRVGGHLLAGGLAVVALGAAAFTGGTAPMELLGLAGGVMLVLSGLVSGKGTGADGDG